MYSSIALAFSTILLNPLSGLGLVNNEKLLNKNIINEKTEILDLKKYNLFAFDTKAKREDTEIYVVRVFGPGAPGSGVMLILPDGKYGFITSKHVLSDLGKGDEIEIKSYNGKSIYAAKENILKMSDYDIAIIVLDSENISKDFPFIPVSIAKRLPFIGEEIYTSGFPLNVNTSISTEIRVTDGKIQTLSKKPQDGYSLGYSSRTYVGMSGGGLFTNKGDLIAIHGRGEAISSDDVNKTGTNYAVPVQTVVNWYRDKMPNKKNSQDIDLASIYILSKNYSDALPIWERIYKKYPDSFIAEYNVACLKIIEEDRVVYWDYDQATEKFKYLQPWTNSKDQALAMYRQDPLVQKLNKISIDNESDEYKKRLYREMLGRVFTQMNSDGAFINMGYIYNYNEGDDPNDPFSNIDRATFKGCALWVTNTNILDPFVPDISIRYNKDLWPKK